MSGGQRGLRAILLKSHYETLGLSHSASKADIDAAWRRAVSLWHPDRNSSAEAVERIREVNAAHHVLMDDARRRKYDLRNGFAEPGRPHMKPPAARDVRPQERSRPQAPRPAQAAQRKKGSDGKRRRSWWERLRETASGDFRPRHDGDARASTLFERRPRLTKYVLVPLGVTAILLAALITIIVT